MKIQIRWMNLGNNKNSKQRQQIDRKIPDIKDSIWYILKFIRRISNNGIKNERKHINKIPL